jgi:hypothetical protein
MKLEKQVVSLELAKELKEVGYPQEGVFYWVEVHNEWILWYWKEVVIDKHLDTKEQGCFVLSREKIVAPTVAELIFQLLNCPQEVDKMYRLCDITADMLARQWIFRKKEGLL